MLCKPEDEEDCDCCGQVTTVLKKGFQRQITQPTISLRLTISYKGALNL
jgi:hypothetical protein